MAALGIITEWGEPVIDRTQSDVDEVKELNSHIGHYIIINDEPASQLSDPERGDMRWIQDLKGALNRSDLFRIGSNIGIILEMVGEETRFRHMYPKAETDPNPIYPYASGQYPGEIRFTPDGRPVDKLYITPEIPNVSYYQILEDTMGSLISYGYGYQTTPQLPSRPYNTYQKWNDIEKILLDIYLVLTESIGVFSYTGNNELFCSSDLI